MGNSSSSLDSNGPSPPSKALHVLRVSPGSPAAQTDIDPFFDFVVGIDNDERGSKNVDAATLGKLVEEHEGKVLPLVIWSAKYRNMRVVPVIPSRGWSQDANSKASDSHPSLLGLSMRICRPDSALDNVWHILEVLENSPAESAGLVPYGDWILGWSGGVLSGENAFYELVENHIDKPLRAVVYSYDFDTIREVVLVPNRKWGGEGLLGCGVGYGLLHRIPPQPMNPEAMDTILKQNLPYDEQNPFGEQPRKEDLDTSTLFVPADDENFEFGGVSGQPKGFPEHSPSPQDDFDETPVAHWHSVNTQPKQTPPPKHTAVSSHDHHGHSHDHEGGDHSHSHSQPHSHSPTNHSQRQHHGHSHDHEDHNHSHSHSPTSHNHSHSHSSAPKAPNLSTRRTDSISSLKSNPPISPPPRASTPTQSGVPTLSHTFAFREARNNSFNGIIKPEPSRRLVSPPAATVVTNSSSRQRMRGGIVHSPAGSGAGTPTRVKSPDAAFSSSGLAAMHINETDGHDRTHEEGADESDSTSRRPGSAGGSITSVD